MQKIIQELKEKLSKWGSQNSTPKVVVQEKSEHSCAAKPKEVHNDSRSNSSLPSKIHDKKVVNQEKGPGGNIFHEEEPIPQGYMPNPQALTLFPQAYMPLPQGQKENTRNTLDEQSISQA